MLRWYRRRNANPRFWSPPKNVSIIMATMITPLSALAAGLDGYFNLYNHQQSHQSLGHLAPAEVHFAVTVPIL
jgi:hypothetical protein